MNNIQFPEPPGEYVRHAGHHWLRGINSDNQSLGLYVLQWNPGSKRWSRSGEVATGRYIEETLSFVSKWEYVQYCPDSDQIPNRRHDKTQLPVPPDYKIRMAGHHWLGNVDMEGRRFDNVVLQWNPGVQKWSHSGHCGTDMYVNVEHWQYLSECPLP